MKLYEFQAKEIFRKYNIPISPFSYLIKDIEDVDKVINYLKLPCVLKAQVLSGGRGKAGGIKIAKTKEDVVKLIKNLFEFVINGEKTHAILIEDYIDIEKELYTSVAIDTTNNNILVLASPFGGIDIEELVVHHPEMIFKVEVDPFTGLKIYQVRYLAKKLGFSGKLINIYTDIISSMYKILIEYDAELVEINPLALTRSKELVAVDAKIILNDPSYYRQREVYEKLEREQEELKIIKSAEELKLKKLGVTAYINFNKEGVAVVSDGAGIGMYAYDLINRLGGSVALYCELGLANDSEKVYQVLKILSDNPMIKVFLINWFGGANLMDDMVKGVLRFKEQNKNVLIVARIAGTNSDNAQKMLENSGIFVSEDINEVVQKVVLARD
jgi:succinyl-CoA synthetase beta subunit